MRLRSLDTLSGRFILIILLSMLFAQFLSVVIFRMQAQDIFASEQLNRQFVNAERVVRFLEGDTEQTVTPEVLLELPGVLAVHDTHSPWPQINTASRVKTDRFLKLLSGGRLRSVDAAVLPVNSYVDAPTGSVSNSALLGGRSFNHLYLSLEIGADRWFNIAFDVLPVRRPPIWPFLILITVSFLIVGTAAGLAANHISRPLNELADASRALGLGKDRAPLRVEGPNDLRQVLSTFNSMRERLEATLDSQKHILIAIGHDLRTPITALRVRTSLIQDPTERQNMDRALDELERLTDAALEAGKEGLEGEPMAVVDAAALMSSVCEDVQDLGWEVSFEDADEGALVRGRPEQLSRALKNILENATRYGARARVCLAADQHTCRINVDDDGPGIPEDLCDQVFDPLFRIEASRNQATGGHGLGLYISRKIVRTHGGDIKLRNRLLGGLTATIELPIVTQS